MSADTPWTARPPHLSREVERDGKVRIYWRKRGRPKRPLASPWGSQALADEAAAIEALEAARPKPTPIAGTLVAAVHQYRGKRELGIDPSADYLALGASTQREYDRWLDRFERDLAGVLCEDVTPGYVMDLRNAWAKRGYRAANVALQVLINVCKRPRIEGAIPGNPFELIEKVARPHDRGEPNPAWHDEEVAAAIEWALTRKTPRPGLARAIALGRWGGFRRGTICKAPRRARIIRQTKDGPERRLYWLTEKKKVLADRREDPRLTELLKRTPNRALTIAYNFDGGPWKERALNAAIDRCVRALAKAGKARSNLTIHGLRHARGVEIAVAGGSDAEIMAQLDHATPRQAAAYRRQAERRGLADSGQAKVDAEIVRLADARTRKKRD